MNFDSSLWGQLVIAGAIVMAVWRLDGHFLTRREFMLQVELLRRDIAAVKAKLECHESSTKDDDNE
jgi:hypothetical protein